ncbi:unnamed protein product, partial [Nesidiocoris tenuis]
MCRTADGRQTADDGQNGPDRKNSLADWYSSFLVVATQRTGLNSGRAVWESFLVPPLH